MIESPTNDFRESDFLDDEDFDFFERVSIRGDYDDDNDYYENEDCFDGKGIFLLLLLLRHQWEESDFYLPL